MILRTILIACEPFGELGAQRAASTIGRAMQAADPTLGVDLCPLETGVQDLETLRDHLTAVSFDVRMRASRAVVLGTERLEEATLLPGRRSTGATFEIATRARQSGVPAYAVAGENELSAFDARVLDLQVILQARDVRALRRAGERLARLV